MLYAGIFNKAEAMITGIRLREAVDHCGTKTTTRPYHRLRLLIVMAEGHAGTLPEAWRSYGQIEEARASATAALRNSQVLRVAIVEDGSRLIGSANPLGFVEWVG